MCETFSNTPDMDSHCYNVLPGDHLKGANAKQTALFVPIGKPIIQQTQAVISDLLILTVILLILN